MKIYRKQLLRRQRTLLKRHSTLQFFKTNKHEFITFFALPTIKQNNKDKQ